MHGCGLWLYSKCMWQTDVLTDPQRQILGRSWMGLLHIMIHRRLWRYRVFDGMKMVEMKDAWLYNKKQRQIPTW